jgi:hypothetical protein
MKCAVHPELDAVGYCRNCGKALCAGCSREVRGMIYCESCLADMVTQPRAVQQGGTSPALATCCGFIPGLGAVYNGEYMKAIIQVCVFVGFILVLQSTNSELVQTVFGISLGAFIFYMLVDANRTAKARLMGQNPPEWFGDAFGGRNVGPFILIGIGVIFLMHNFDVLDLDRLFERWWPLIFIGAGAFLVWRRGNTQSK